MDLILNKDLLIVDWANETEEVSNGILHKEKDVIYAEPGITVATVADTDAPADLAPHKYSYIDSAFVENPDYDPTIFEPQPEE